MGSKFLFHRPHFHQSFFLNYQFSIDVNCVQILGKEIEDIKVLPGGGFLVETDEGTSESGPGELGWPG